LLTKLHFYGIQGIAAEWFRPHLTDSKQKAEIKLPKNNQFFLNLGNNKDGVPKGSILQPLLFTVYTNDVPSTINTLSEPILFADDISINFYQKFW
jgi:hypothetical protein